LALKEKISREDLERLIGPKLLAKIPQINQAFREIDTDKLQPVFEKFNGKYSYNEIRLARLIMAFDWKA